MGALIGAIQVPNHIQSSNSLVLGRRMINREQWFQECCKNPHQIATLILKLKTNHHPQYELAIEKRNAQVDEPASCLMPKIVEKGLKAFCECIANDKNLYSPSNAMGWWMLLPHKR